MFDLADIIKRFFQCFWDTGWKNTIQRSIYYIDRYLHAKDRAQQKLADYVNYIEMEQQKRFTNNQPDFVALAKDDYQRLPDGPKVIAWYLPQFYQMEVNNKYHGQGFTEWSNTSQILPQFTGHYQPHVPYDVGYYDLNNVQTLKRQVYLAHKYGVYGFCFHWYWFSGQRIMEKPLQLLLDHPEINIHYCFDWATENWTSAWDGGTKEVIFEQGLKDGDAEKLMHDLLPFFRDKRYIKINGRPVLSIYRCDMFEKEAFLNFVKELRRLVQLEGFPDMYFMLTNREFNGDVTEWGLDALVEFPPVCIYGRCYRPEKLGVYTNAKLKADFFDIRPVVQSQLYYTDYPSKDIYRSALVGFDNSVRRATTGCQIVLNDTPEMFESWMKGLLIENKAIHTGENNYVFVNSWNEWAEGSHLEPDMKYGYAYLQAVRNALETYDRYDTTIIENEVKAAQGRKIIFYIHMIESLGDIVAAEPIVRYLHLLYPTAQFVWIIKASYQSLVKNHPLIYQVIPVQCLDESAALCAKYAAESGRIIVDCHFDGRMCCLTKNIHVNKRNAAINEKTYLYAGSLLESFCLSAGMEPIDDTPHLYLAENTQVDKVLPKKYIVVHCTSAETIKDWDLEKWNILSAALIANGYNVVEIGLSPVISSTSSHYYDCTDIHDLQEIAKVIQGAACFIGIDSGFAHMANAFHVYGVLIFGQYKNFRKPMPYSGNYKKRECAQIIYASQGYAKNVAVHDVYTAVRQKLENVER